MKLIVSIVILVFILSGCKRLVHPVKPWERQVLGKKSMALDPDPAQTKLRRHIFYSKEGSIGGAGTVGGGCGCN